jgi:hypothetical protein
MAKMDDLLAELSNLGALGNEVAVEKPAPKPPKVVPVEVPTESAPPVSEEEEALSAFTADYTLGEDAEDEDAPLEEEEAVEEDEEAEEEDDADADAEDEEEVAELAFDAEDVMRRLRSLLKRVNGIEDEVRSLARILSEAVEPRSDSDA